MAGGAPSVRPGAWQAGPGHGVPEVAVTGATYLMLALAVLLAASGLLLLASVHGRREQEAVDERLGFPRSADEGRRQGAFGRLILRAGLAEHPGLTWTILAAWPVAGLAGLVLAGWWGSVAGLGGAVLLGYGVVEWQARRRARQLVAQLPGFVEHVSRSLRAGRTLSAAVQAATAESRPPLREAMQRAEREVGLGASLGDALDGVAEAYRLDALRLVALGVRFNLRYGGSARDLMEQVVAVLRRRERAHRQLRALTGGTRFSAAVLAVLPTAVALYTVAMSPDYYAAILADPQGPWLLGGALFWQGLGIFVLWRMMKRL